MVWKYKVRKAIEGKLQKSMVSFTIFLHQNEIILEMEWVWKQLALTKY